MNITHSHTHLHIHTHTHTHIHTHSHTYIFNQTHHYPALLGYGTFGFIYNIGILIIILIVYIRPLSAIQERYHRYIFLDYHCIYQTIVSDTRQISLTLIQQIPHLNLNNHHLYQTIVLERHFFIQTGCHKYFLTK